MPRKMLASWMLLPALFVSTSLALREPVEEHVRVPLLLDDFSFHMQDPLASSFVDVNEQGKGKCPDLVVPPPPGLPNREQLLLTRTEGLMTAEDGYYRNTHGRVEYVDVPRCLIESISSGEQKSAMVGTGKFNVKSVLMVNECWTDVGVNYPPSDCGYKGEAEYWLETVDNPDPADKFRLKCQLWETGGRTFLFSARDQCYQCEHLSDVDQLIFKEGEAVFRMFEVVDKSESTASPVNTSLLVQQSTSAMVAGPHSQEGVAIGTRTPDAKAASTVLIMEQWINIDCFLRIYGMAAEGKSKDFLFEQDCLCKKRGYLKIDGGKRICHDDPATIRTQTQRWKATKIDTKIDTSWMTDLLPDPDADPDPDLE